MATDPQKEKSGLEHTAQAAGAVKGAIKAGKALAGASKGAAFGPYGMAAGLAWEGRKVIAKVVIVLVALLLLPVMILIGNQKAEENMQLLNLPGKHGFIDIGRIQQISNRGIGLADFHNVDTIWRCRAYLNELTTDVVAGTVEFIALQRSDNECLDILSSHSQCHKLHGECLTGTGCAENRHIRILVNTAVKDIHNDERVIVLVDTEQNAVVIAHLKGRKRITACHASCQNVSFGACK